MNKGYKNVCERAKNYILLAPVLLLFKTQESHREV